MNVWDRRLATPTPRAPTGRAARRRAAASAVTAAEAAERAGYLDVAMAHYRRALAEPVSRVASRAALGLGRCLLGVGRPAEAVPLLSQAVAAEPNSPALAHLLGVCLLEAGDFTAAISALDRALALAPGSGPILSSLGAATLRAGDAVRAEQLFRRAVAADPADEGARLRLAATLLYAGRPGAARDVYRGMLAAGSHNTLAFTGLAETGDFAEEPPEYAAIAAMADDEARAPVERRMLHFAAARIDRGLRRDDRDFAHAAAGKALLPPFDLGYFEATVDALIEAVTPRFLEERAGAAHASEEPVFIFGMPRSGTSLMEQVIAAHPDAAAGGELPFFNEVAAKLGVRFTPGPGSEPPDRLGRHLERLDARILAPLAEPYLSRLRQRGAARRITDKTPHNFLHLWIIALLFPHARFIHARRDALATCVSCFTTDLGSWHAYARDLPTLGRYYRVYERLMRHWLSVLPVPVAESRYEGLAAAPRTAGPDLLAAAGLAWDPRCLDFHEGMGAVQTASWAQLREPIHARRIAGWRRYERHLEPLKAALGQSLTPAASPPPQRSRCDACCAPSG